MLEDGSEVRATTVLSNATPKVTFTDLLPKVGGFERKKVWLSYLASYNTIFQETLPKDFQKHVEGIDYTSSVTKINGTPWFMYTLSLHFTFMYLCSWKLLSVLL